MKNVPGIRGKEFQETNVEEEGRKVVTFSLLSFHAYFSHSGTELEQAPLFGPTSNIIEYYYI